MVDRWLLGIVQNRVVDNKTENIAKARTMIMKAADAGAQTVVLPEMFNCPYSGTMFPKYAETYPDGETLKMLADTANSRGIYLFGGSVPEQDGQSIYNTCFVFGPEGQLLARHRKVHLFDVNLKDGLSFRESDTLGCGEQITVVDTPLGGIGVGICYDIRFPELSRAVALRGATVLVLPAAFNMITGPVHWEMSVRMRALDNQMYVAGAAPARNEKASYVAYGHSVVADPWGQVVGSLDEKEGLLITEIDPERIREVREQLPLLKHRRTDLYELREFPVKEH